MKYRNNALARRLSTAKRVVLVGDAEQLKRACETVVPEGVSVVAVFSDGVSSARFEQTVYLDEVTAAVPYLETHPVDLVLTTLYSLTIAQASALSNYCSDSATAIFALPMHAGNIWPHVTMTTYEGGLALSPCVLAYDKWYNRIMRRVLELLLVLVLLLTVFPIVCLVAFVTVKLGKAGSVLVTAPRFDRCGKSFACWQFRTDHQTEGHEFAGGKFLRRSHLYAWPQLFNVLMGNMSLVGPQLGSLALNQPDAGLLSQFMRRHRVKNGITSLARVKAVADCPLSQRRKMEADYVRRWSLWTDVCILWRTFLIML